MYASACATYGVSIDTDLKNMKPLWDSLTPDERAETEDHYEVKFDDIAKKFGVESYEYSEFMEDIMRQVLLSRNLNFDAVRPNGIHEDQVGGLIYCMGAGVEANGGNYSFLDPILNPDPVEKKVFDDFFKEFFPNSKPGLLIYTTAG